MWACRPWVWEIIYRMHKHPFAALCRPPGCRSPRYTREGPKLFYLPSKLQMVAHSSSDLSMYLTSLVHIKFLNMWPQSILILIFFPEARLSVERLQADNLRGSLFTQLVQGECFQMKLFSAWKKSWCFQFSPGEARGRLWRWESSVPCDSTWYFPVMFPTTKEQEEG